MKLRYLYAVSMTTMFNQTNAPPVDFDVQQYRRINPYTAKMPDNEIIRYYVEHGMKEGVRYRTGQTIPYPTIQQSIEELRLGNWQPLFD
jgi:hypothetical protein